MRRRWLAMLALVAGCNQFYGLDSTRAVDAALFDAAPDAPDGDLDGVPDANDNCINTANANQHDEDLDTVGDACDNCPLTANGLQEDLGETDSGTADGVGDACDPNPTDPGDCLVLFESFLEPAGFAQHWRQIGLGPAPVAQIDQIQLTGSLESVELTGRIFNVQATGIAAVQEAGSVGVTSNAQKTDDGHACAVFLDLGSHTVKAQIQPDTLPPVGPATVDKLSAVPVGSAFELRLTADRRAGSSDAMVCRAEHGYAIGVSRATTASAIEMLGGPGIRMTPGTATVTAIAVYESTPPATCATTRR